MSSKQNRKKMLIAITIAVFAAFGMFNSINSQKSMINELNTRIQKQDSTINDLKNKALSTAGQIINQSTTAVVSKTDLKAGQALTVDMLELKDLGTGAPADKYSDISSLNGKFLSQDIKAGEAIVKAKVLGAEFVNLDIPIGMRAITIPVDYIQGLASYLTVGSRVDIISTAKGKENKPEMILQNVKLISLEGVPPGDTSPATKATAITLQIPASLASRLVSSMIDGKLQVITRNFQDNKLVGSSKSRSYGDSGARNGDSSNIKFELPPPPKDMKGLDILPSPATLPVRTESKKIELIQANNKTEMSFDGN